MTERITRSTNTTAQELESMGQRLSAALQDALNRRVDNLNSTVNTQLSSQDIKLASLEGKLNEITRLINTLDTMNDLIR